MKKVRETFQEMRHSFAQMQRKHSRVSNRIDRFLMTAKQNHDEIKKEMKKLENASRDMEETNLNILLAIRQNEYLQAWYPAQSGFPEMKVVGTHPINLKGKNG